LLLLFSGCAIFCWTQPTLPTSELCTVFSLNNTKIISLNNISKIRLNISNEKNFQSIVCTNIVEKRILNREKASTPGRFKYLLCNREFLSFVRFSKLAELWNNLYGGTILKFILRIYLCTIQTYTIYSYYERTLPSFKHLSKIIRMKWFATMIL